LHEAIGEHTHADMDEVLYIVAGEGTIRARGESSTVSAGGLSVIPHGVPHAIEVNPRWSASMELVERAYNISVFGVHATACITGALPTFDLLRVRGSTPAIGKAVVFARLDVRVGDTSHWLADSSVRDVPRPGERILAGRPVCTIIAEGRDDASCYLGLVRQAEGVYATLDAWSR